MAFSMNGKNVALILVWILLLMACSDDNNSSKQVSEQTSSKANQNQQAPTVNSTSTTASLSVAPVEEAFDKEAVLRDYANTPLTILDISERNKEGRNAFAITLSVPIDPAKDHQDYFNVSTKNKGVVDGAWIISNSGKTLWFNFIEPETTYTISVHQGLVAANNQRLAVSASETITTRKLNPSVSFNTQGAFLTAGLSKGIPVLSVNVAAVDINFYRVREKELQSFLTAISDRYYYWNVDRFTHFSDLVYSGRYELDAPKNTQTKRNIDVEAVNELKQPGIYLAIMNKAGAYQNQQVIWFSITDIGLHARFYDQQIDVYASSLKTGKALKHVNVSLLNKKGELLQQIATSPSGQASFNAITSKLDEVSLIIAENEQHFSLIEVNKPALDLSDFDIGVRANKAQELFIYAARDLYRPNEFIDFNALLRGNDGQLLPASILKAAIHSPEGTKIKTFKWHGNEQGYYHYNWQIPASAQLGQWWLSVETLDKTITRYDFQVEEFLPERLKLTFNSLLKDVAINVSAESGTDNNKTTSKRLITDKVSPIALPVLGEYLYGAPASGNRLSSMAHVSLWRNPVEKFPQFEFGNIKQTEFNQQFDLADSQLNDDGEGIIHFTGDWTHSQNPLQSPLRVKFISSLYESGGRPVTRAYSTLVWPQTYMLGIRSSFGDENPKANSRVSFELMKTNLAGKQQSAKNIDVKLIREDRRYFWVYSNGQGWHYEWSDKEFVERTTTLNIVTGELAKVEFPVAWGNYRIEVREAGAGLLSSMRFYAGTNWYESWQESQQGSGAARPNKITMALDKGAYFFEEDEAKDEGTGKRNVAKVNIIPPHAGEGLILVEGDKLLWSKRLYIPAEGITVEIPLSAQWQQHNIYISSMVLQSTKNVQAEQTPKRSFGLIHLPLQREHRQLAIELDVAEKALPSKKLPVNIHVSLNKSTANKSETSKNTANKKQVFVTLAAVDVGVLSISDFDTPDPVTAFFGQRRYSVDARDVYAKVIEINGNDKARLRFGGDADSELKRGGQAPQSDVQIVSLFSGLVKLDAQGNAQILLDVPEFNGRLRLMALAFGDDTFGSNDQEVTIAAPVVSQMSLPRFLAKDDIATIALDLTNLSGETQQLNVQLTASAAVTFSDGKIANNQTIALADGEKTTLRYQVQAQAVTGMGSFALAVESIAAKNDTVKNTTNGENNHQQITINRQWQLGLRPAYPAVIRQKQQLLAYGETLSVDETNITDLLTDTIQASISISPRANIDLQTQLNNLLQYPYGCLEQTSSRVYPLIYATPVQQKVFNLKAISEQKRLDMINKGIERLASLQLGSGGFGLWDNNSHEEYWLTAYVADFLVNARDMGIDVPQEMLARTLKRLQRYLARSGRFYDEPWSEDVKHYNFAYKAYAAYVLARVNQAPLGTLRSLANKYSNNARTGLSQLQLAIALAKMGDKKRSLALLTTALNNLPKQSGTYLGAYLGDYGSQVRDLAMMIHLMLKHNMATDTAIALSFELADQLQQRQWLSTQERNALFLAGMSLQNIQTNNPIDGGLWSANLFLGRSLNKDSGKDLSKGLSKQINITQQADYQQALTAKSISQKVAIKSTYQQPLLANISILGYGKQAPKASANGLSIRRHWLTLTGKEISANDINNVNVGDLFLVHLQVNAEQRTPDALVTDLLPAGFELENQNLEHSIKLDEIKVAGKTLEHWQNSRQVKHQEYRDDRYVAAVELSKHNTTHLFYLIRAVTPGEYTVPAPLVEDMYRAELRGIGEREISKIIIHRKTSK